MRNYGEIPERSFVTVLAVDTVGSTKHIAGHDPDEAQAFFDDIMEHLSAIIEDAGGMLASFHGDGGFGIFGWPNSLEAHADLACEAAWNIQHPHAPFSSSLGAEKKTVQFRVGIHSGLVGFRQLQLEVGSNFDLVGETIHYAASLEKQCEPGGIVISQKTVDLCEHELSLSLFEQDGAAGSERTRIHKLLENPQRANNSEARQNYPFPIIGRTTERQYLHEQLNPLAEKLPVIAIIGEPGIGKSRLATSAANHWHDSNHRIFSFKGDIKQGRSPFALFRHLFEIALKTEDYSGSVLDKLLQAGASEETAQQVATMLDEDDPGPQQGRSILTQRQVARILVQSFAQLMGAENTLIFVEDLHLVDLESRECLALLQQLDSCNHIGALVTGRPEAYEAAVQLSDDILMLEAMPQEDLSELAERLRKSQGLSVAVSDNLLKQADGVPFVLEQLIYSLQLGDSEDNAIPQSIESLIHGRLNSLSGEAKSVLQALSLIGEQSDIVFIAELVGVDGNDLSEILAESSAIGLINPLRGQSVRFRHAIIADACATTVPKATKQKVHQRAIDVFSVLYSDLDQHYEQLAFHAENAGDDENAIEYYWLAGLRARKRSATGSLLLIFKQALSCMNRVGAPANDRYVDFVLMAYASLIQVGEFTEMKSHLPKALELVKQQSNVGKICAALCNQGMANWFDGLYESGLETTEEALVMARAMNSMPHIFAAQLMMASVLHGMGKVREAINLQRELCELFPDDTDGARLGATAVPASMARSFLSWFLLDIGEFDEAYDAALAAAKIAKGHNDTYSELLSQTAIARSLLALGKAAEARSVLATAKDDAEREGYDALVPHLAGRLAVSMVRTGGATDAISLVEGLLAEDVARRTGQSEMVYLYLGYSEALIESGQQEEAERAMQEALKIAKSIGNPSLEVQSLSIKLHAQRWFGASEKEISQTLSDIEKICAAYSIIAAGTPPEPIAD